MVRLQGTHGEMQRASAKYLEGLAARYAAYMNGEDDLADLSPGEMMTAAGFYHSRAQYQHQARVQAGLVEAKVRARTRPRGLDPKEITNQQIAKAWVACCRDYPKLTAHDVDDAVGEELGVSGRVVRGRRLVWGPKGGGKKWIRDQMRSIRGEPV